jgi:hypothetical protein
LAITNQVLAPKVVDNDWKCKNLSCNLSFFHLCQLFINTDSWVVMGRKPKIQVVAWICFSLSNYFHCYSQHQKYFNNGKKKLKERLKEEKKTYLELSSLSSSWQNKAQKTSLSMDMFLHTSSH